MPHAMQVLLFSAFCLLLMCPALLDLGGVLHVDKQVPGA